MGLTRLSLATAGARPEYARFPEGGRAANVRALYVHVPFCTTKCHYCDFYSLAGHLGEADNYLAALEREIALQTALVGRCVPETVFIGGGTPTLLDAGRLERLLGIIQAAADLGGVREFTIEANPNTFSPDRAAVLARLGVNRISFGAQSFVQSELETLQRDHDPENVPLAVAMARAAGIENINIDLIFGTPGQTLASWEYSLGRALALEPQHLSAYSLIYEPNTAMTARMKRGEFALLDEELELAMFNRVYEMLRAAGLERYEVSNHARPGLECRHNLHYWMGSEYLAWGPAAAAYVGGYRWKNVQSLAHYLEALLGPAPVLPLTQMERLDPIRHAGELAMLQLRLVAGIEFAAFEARTGVDPRPRLAQVLAKYEGLGLLAVSATRLALTDKAVPVSDAIVADVLEAFS